MDYVLTPSLAWLIAGSLKFLINSFSQKRLAFSLIGYGGFPSNHSAIVSSTAALMAFKYGVDSPFFGIAFTFFFIVLLDAKSLRGEVGKHAARLNQLSPAEKPFRERMGHKSYEILCGVLVGVFTAWVVVIF